VHGLEGKEGSAAFLPCSEATAEKRDGRDVALAKFGGGVNSGGTPADRGTTLCEGGASGTRVGVL
jgi:hypothetical protein